MDPGLMASFYARELDMSKKKQERIFDHLII